MLDGLIALLMTWIKEFLNWIIAWAFETIDGMLMPVVDLIPDLELSSRWSSIVQYLSWANKWIPLDLVCLLLIAFIAIFLAVNLINWILGLIPTLN